MTTPYEKRKKRKQKIREHLKQVPTKYKRMYEKAVGGHSPKNAIHMFCLECVNFSHKEVEECTVLDCPLYPYRKKRDADTEET